MAANPRADALETHVEHGSASQPESMLPRTDPREAQHPPRATSASETRPDDVSLKSPASDESAALRHEAIAQGAYFLAEARGFEPGHELDDWLAAEQQAGLH